MKKTILAVLALLAALTATAAALQGEQQALAGKLVRLHVVANSDSPEDQAVKLQVKDAVLVSLGETLEKGLSPQAAREYLENNLDKIQKIANTALETLGMEDRAVVQLCREAFETRQGEGITLPAGIYQALRITIGNGQGHNWWGVLFPELCYGTGESSPASLVGAVTGEETGKIRFFLLEKLGQLENYLHGA